MFNGRFPDIKNCSLLPHTPLSHRLFIACRPIPHEFLFLSVKPPNCLEMFQSRENTSLPSFPFSRRMNLSSVLRPLIPRILWVFFWTLLAKSVQLLEKNEYFPFQGKTMNPRNLGQRKILRIQLKICYPFALPCFQWQWSPIFAINSFVVFTSLPKYLRRIAKSL